MYYGGFAPKPKVQKFPTLMMVIYVTYTLNTAIVGITILVLYSFFSYILRKICFPIGCVILGSIFFVSHYSISDLWAESIAGYNFCCAKFYFSRCSFKCEEKMICRIDVQPDKLQQTRL